MTHALLSLNLIVLCLILWALRQKPAVLPPSPPVAPPRPAAPAPPSHGLPIWEKLRLEGTEWVTHSRVRQGSQAWAEAIETPGWAVRLAEKVELGKQ